MRSTPSIDARGVLLSVQCDVVISPPVEFLPIKSYSLLSDRDARDVWPDF